jgi:hypothetical protein
MAAQTLSVGSNKWTATSADAIDLELRPRVPCEVDIAITKPASSVVTVKKKYADGSVQDQIVSADATTGTTVEITAIRLYPGDELQVDIDTTSGDKIVSAQARRLT